MSFSIIGENNSNDTIPSIIPFNSVGQLITSDSNFDQILLNPGPDNSVLSSQSNNIQWNDIGNLNNNSITTNSLITTSADIQNLNTNKIMNSQDITTDSLVTRQIDNSERIFTDVLNSNSLNNTGNITTNSVSTSSLISNSISTNSISSTSINNTTTIATNALSSVNATLSGSLTVNGTSNLTGTVAVANIANFNGVTTFNNNLFTHNSNSNTSIARFSASATNGNIVIQNNPSPNLGFSSIAFNGSFNGSELRYNTAKRRYRLISDHRASVDQFTLESYDGVTIRLHEVLDVSLDNTMRFPLGIRSPSINTISGTSLILNSHTFNGIAIAATVGTNSTYQGLSITSGIIQSVNTTLTGAPTGFSGVYSQLYHRSSNLIAFCRQSNDSSLTCNITGPMIFTPPATFLPTTRSHQLLSITLNGNPATAMIYSDTADSKIKVFRDINFSSFISTDTITIRGFTFTYG